MSCHLKTFAKIVNLDAVKRCLYSNDAITADGFEGDSWGWGEEDDSTVKDNWLDDSTFVSLSPTSELLVLARDRNVVILNAKWDTDENNEEIITYKIAWNGDATLQLNETITCVLCIPIAGSGKSSAQSGADWTAVAVGYNTGTVRFFTENGSLLISEVFHEGSVVDLKFQSYQLISSYSVSQQADELHVSYCKTVCNVHGFSLCNALKTCRNQLARVEANCSDRVEAPPLSFIKWTLPEQEVINDACIIGSTTSSIFNHLTTASLRGGFFATYRSSPPLVSSVIAAGASPFLAWHCLIEGAGGPVLSDVAKAVASKLKTAFGSAVPGWLGVGRRGSEEKPKEKLTDFSESMACRFGLCDVIRKGERLCLSPDKKLCAVCDSLGRVILVDVASGIALRIWKGYRDAECAFIPVDEDTENPATSRRALYLALFAPKMGAIEVWALQRGPKIAVLQGSKNGRLIYISYGLAGTNSISQKALSNSFHPCVFVNNNGEIGQVCVPFHAILSDKKDPRNRDLAVLKQIKKCFHSGIVNRAQEFLDLCEQVSSNEIRVKVLECSSSCKSISPTLIRSAVDIFKRTQPTDGETDEWAEKCLQYCQNIEKIIDFYSATGYLEDIPPQYSTVVPYSPSEETLECSETLRLNEDEYKRVTLLTKHYVDNGRIAVRFNETCNNFSIILRSFKNVYTHNGPLTFSPSTKSEELVSIGEAFCKCVLYGSCEVDDWAQHAKNSGIEPRCLMRAVVAYWLKKPLGANVTSEMTLFMRILQTITSLDSSKDMADWWEEMRATIAECSNLLNSLTCTIVSRAVFLSYEDQSPEDKESDWETISRETCLWSQLMSQLEAVALLQSSLSYKPKKDGKSALPRLDCPKQDISLANVISKGPGLISESVAQWICSWGLSPDWLSSFTDSPSTSSDMESRLGVVEGVSPQIDESSEAHCTTDVEDVVIEKCKSLREYFPHSLSLGPLLANITWEYLLAWSKSLDDVELLSAAITCLQSIPSVHLKQGLCSVIWNAHLKVHFENIVKLLHKIGKLPKESLCRQYLNLADTNVENVLKIIIRFFDLFIECVEGACQDAFENETLGRERLWTGETQLSLAEIALNQRVANLNILTVQYICARALYLIVSCHVRQHRPVTSILHPTEESLLWADIRNAADNVGLSSDPKLQENRTSFLCKVIKAASERIQNNPDVSDVKEFANVCKQCISLGADWELPLDRLRTEHVISLYRSNGDSYANEIVGTVGDKEALGVRLLFLVGERMSSLLQNSNKELKERMSSFSPSLTTWIKDQEPSKYDCDLKKTMQLSSLVTTLIPEENSNYKLAILLADGISSISS